MGDFWETFYLTYWFQEQSYETCQESSQLYSWKPRLFKTGDASFSNRDILPCLALFGQALRTSPTNCEFESRLAIALQIWAMLACGASAKALCTSDRATLNGCRKTTWARGF